MDSSVSVAFRARSRRSLADSTKLRQICGRSASSFATILASGGSLSARWVTAIIPSSPVGERSTVPNDADSLGAPKVLVQRVGIPFLGRHDIDVSKKTCMRTG